MISPGEWIPPQPVSSCPFCTITPLHSMLSWTLSVKFALMEIGITLQIFRLIYMGCMSHELISGITVRNLFFYLSMTILLDLSHGTIYHKSENWGNIAQPLSFVRLVYMHVVRRINTFSFRSSNYIINLLAREMNCFTMQSKSLIFFCRALVYQMCNNITKWVESFSCPILKKSPMLRETLKRKNKTKRQT